jgi:hypothetical protein
MIHLDLHPKLKMGGDHDPPRFASWVGYVTFATGRRMFGFTPPVKTEFHTGYESNDLEDVSQLHVPAKPMPSLSLRTSHTYGAPPRVLFKGGWS